MPRPNIKGDITTIMDFVRKASIYLAGYKPNAIASILWHPQCMRVCDFYMVKKGLLDSSTKCTRDISRVKKNYKPAEKIPVSIEKTSETVVCS
jgi:hypothetical protein